MFLPSLRSARWLPFIILWPLLAFCRNGAPRPPANRIDTAILISADAEWSVVKSLFPEARVEVSPLGEHFVRDIPLSSGAKVPVLVFHGGWGKVAAAASTQYVIEHWNPAWLINLGTCGGFQGSVEVFDVVLATRTVIYDIVERMGDPAEATAHYATDLDLSELAGPDPPGVKRGVLVSADQDLDPTAIDRLKKDYGAVAADWESGAIAYTARKSGKRTLIIRGVTDLVGPHGSEAYGDLGAFQRRTEVVMKKLVDGLPGWLERAGAFSGPAKMKKGGGKFSR